MIDNKKVLAIIPARGGSKGLPKKNELLLAGKPLIAWTIESALKIEYIDKVVVSTDDTKIADISKKFGAHVPFLRPANLSTDSASTLDVVLHCIEWYQQKKEEFDYVLLLQPTSPLRTPQDILNSLQLMKDKNAKSIVSICESDHHPYWMNTLPKNLNMRNFIKKKFVNLGRQSLPKYYRLNGAIYLSEIDYLKTLKSFIGPKTYAFIMGKINSVDIDDLFDFKFAEFIVKENLVFN